MLKPSRWFSVVPSLGLLFALTEGGCSSPSSGGANGAEDQLGGSSSGGMLTSSGGESASGGAGMGASASGGDSTTASWPTWYAPYSGKAFVEDWKPLSAEPFASERAEWPTGAGDSVTVTADVSAVTASISPHLFGHTAPAYNPTEFYMKADVLAKVKAVKPAIIRFPGGSIANHYHWDGNTPAGKDSPSALPWLKFLEYLKATGAAPLLEVNYAYARYGSLEAATKLAADWVEYCNAEVGANPNGGDDMAAKRVADGFPEPFHVKYWELGNENYGNWEGDGYEPNGADYGKNYAAFQAAMKAVDPNIYLGYVGAGKGSCCGANTWFEDGLGALKSAGESADYWIIHNYFTDTPKPGVNLMPNLSQIGETTSYLDGLVSSKTSQASGSVPYALTEYNSAITFSDRGYDSMQPNQLVGGLFVGKMLGEYAKAGWELAAYWNIANGWPGADKNGNFTSDHGFLARFQEDSGVPEGTPHSQYYPFYVWARAGGDSLVSSTSSDSANVTAYATKFSASDDVGLILVNESGSAKKIEVKLNGNTPEGKANAWILSGKDLFDKNFLWNGKAGPGDYSGPDPLSPETRPYSTTFSGSSVTLTVPPYSLTGITIH